MTFRSQILLLLIGTCISALHAQVVDTLRGCDELPTTGSAPLSCANCGDKSFTYSSTIGYTASPAGNWCGTIDNDQYIAFQPTPSGELNIQLAVATGSLTEGIQVGVVNSANQLMGPCLNQVRPGQSIPYSVSGLDPKEVFFLRIDGFGGDDAEFLIRWLDTDTTRAYTAEVLHQADTTFVIAQRLACEAIGIPGEDIDNSTCSYSLAYTFEPQASGTRSVVYADYKIGERYDWAHRRAIRAEVSRTYTRSSGTGCAQTLSVPYYSHFLDLEPNAAPEPVWEWNCQQDRVAFTLAAGDTQRVSFYAAVQSEYLLEVAGFSGYDNATDELALDYTTSEGELGRLNNSNTQHPLSLDFSAGPVTLVLSNGSDWTIEYALTAVGGTNRVRTIALPVANLVADSVAIFSGLAGIPAQFAQTPGSYTLEIGCVRYLQEVRVPGSIILIDNGTATICEGDCLQSASGIQLGCDAGNYRVDGPNDSVFIGEIIVDRSPPLELLETRYSCDSLVGMYTVTFEWTGSRAPYHLGSTRYDSTAATVGPFSSGQHVRYLLAGSSMCSEPFFIEAQMTCELSSVAATEPDEALAPRLTRIAPGRYVVEGVQPGDNLVLVDAGGRICWGNLAAGQQEEFATADLPSGIYFLVVTSATNRYTLRLHQ